MNSANLFNQEKREDLSSNEKKWEFMLQDKKTLDELLNDDKIWGIATEKKIILDSSLSPTSFEYKDIIDALASTWKYWLKHDEGKDISTEYHTFFEERMKKYLDEYVQKRIKEKEVEHITKAEKMNEIRKKYGEQLMLNFDQKDNRAA